MVQTRISFDLQARFVADFLYASLFFCFGISNTGSDFIAPRDMPCCLSEVKKAGCL